MMQFECSLDVGLGPLLYFGTHSLNFERSPTHHCIQAQVFRYDICYLCFCLLWFDLLAMEDQPQVKRLKHGINIRSLEHNISVTLQSKLADHLLKDFAWGFQSAPQVQHSAELATRFGSCWCASDYLSQS